jgi:cytochrome c
MKTLIMTASMLAIALLSAASAAPVAITLPPEASTLKPSSLPGYALAQQHCLTCHSVDYIRYQPASLSLAQWTAEAGKMQHVYGAPLTDQDVATIGAYLAVAYGNVKEESLPAALRQGAAPAPAAAGGAINVTALLAANACLGCHAVDKKIVGPAYRDVAAKYKGDPAALATLQQSLRQGSAGKWGPAAMPPFARLTPEETKALAEYVLEQ